MAQLQSHACFMPQLVDAPSNCLPAMQRWPRAEAMWQSQLGNRAAWAGAAPYLAEHPAAAAALQMAVACLSATQTAR